MVGPTRQYRLQGWVVSALIHGLALTVALGLMAQVKPIVPKEPFTWDVALVEPQRSQETPQAGEKPHQDPTNPTPRQTVSAPNKPKTVTREGQPQQPREVTPLVQREVRQSVETSQPIQQTVVAQTRTEALMPIKEQQPAEVQQPTQPTIESVVPPFQQEAVTAEPAMTPAAAPPQAMIQPVVTEEPAIETASVTHDPNPPAPPAPAAAALIDAKPAESIARESAPQMAMATSPTTAVKADYGWLAESLRRRLAEIKHYPSAARLNGWEGKVILRAVIRADGQLSEVKVHRSSGHEALDNAAMEAIRLVCPLHMTNTIAAAEIAVLVPMVYSLGS